VEVVRETMDAIMANTGEPKDLGDLNQRLEDDRTPLQHVFYQECERMNILQKVLKASLHELKDGLDGNLSMTDKMVDLQDQLFLDKLPAVWEKVSFMTLRPLASWFENMSARDIQLNEWTSELISPKVTHLNYFFNPMSFLTAIMQQTAIAGSFPLDSMGLLSVVTKRMEHDSAARDGQHVTGLHMEGARWDIPTGSIDDSKMKELYPKLPVTTISALPNNRLDRKDQHETPVYKTQLRGPGFVVAIYLKTKQRCVKWTIAGVSILLDVVE